MTIDAPITPFEGTPAAAVWPDAHHAPPWRAGTSTAA